MVALFRAALCGIAYVAAEPIIRRQWPDLLISWARITNGKWNDPRVGRDVLIGVLVGVFACKLPDWICSRLVPEACEPAFMLGGTDLTGHVVRVFLTSLEYAYLDLMYLLLFRYMLRSKFVSGILLAGVVTFFVNTVYARPLAVFPLYYLAFGAMIWLTHSLRTSSLCYFDMDHAYLESVFPSPWIHQPTYFETGMTLLVLVELIAVGSFMMVLRTGRMSL